MDSYYKLRQRIYYKLSRSLLRIATGVTKCDGVITKIATVQTSLQGRSLSSLLSTLYILARVGWKKMYRIYSIKHPTSN